MFLKRRLIGLEIINCKADYFIDLFLSPRSDLCKYGESDLLIKINKSISSQYSLIGDFNGIRI